MPTHPLSRLAGDRTDNGSAKVNPCKQHDSDDEEEGDLHNQPDQSFLDMIVDHDTDLRGSN